ncbi:MAG: hypothetical protein IPK70_16935 [Flavobacteriales bacterium]|jgi:hypothetical protein|nr:hypothetical protein [Flavobacteriales bacterium]
MAMKNRYAAVVGFLLCSTPSQAQQPFLTHTDEPVWSVMVTIYGIGISYSTHTTVMSSSVFMCGHEYSVANVGAAGGYFRNEGSKTYFRRSTLCSEPEYLAYDFTLEIGDTAYVGVLPIFTPDEIPFRLESIDTVMINQIQRRRFHMRYNPFWIGDPEPLYVSMHWVEGLGALPDPFFHFRCLDSTCDVGYTLLCNDSLGVRIYQLGSTCSVSNVGIPEGGEPSASRFYAHMEDGQVRLSYPDRFRNGALRILDPSGKVLFTGRVDAHVRFLGMPSFTSSILLAELADEGGTRWIARFIATHH